MSEDQGAGQESQRLRELYEQRAAKADALRAAGTDPYPARTERSHTLAEARAAFEEAADDQPPNVAVAGRVTAIRNMGQIAFLDIADGSDRLQILAQEEPLGDGWALLGQLDLGDFIAAAGEMTRTRRGEVSLGASSLSLISKALRPAPEKFHGLQDTEARYRQRYLDLQINKDARQVFERRSQIVAALRRFMDGRGFMEVETPVLQAEAGGAAARPFETHFNALDEQRHLRIALELHLKRLIVGGFDKVYEIGRIFRNEGVGNRWNPEFTMLESYEAYADYGDVAEMVEQAVSTIAEEVLGALKLPWGEREIDLTPPFRRLTMVEAVGEHVGVDFRDYDSSEALRELLREKNLQVPENAGWGKLFDKLVSELVEPHLVQPTFLLDYPTELSPLAKRKPEEPELVERFELFVGGWEIGNAYSELNDPRDQRARFEEQLKLRDAGDDEAELIDEDFLVALEHGMPPTGGLGMGIDRLVMVLTNQQSIRDVILFPHLRRLDR